MGDIADMMLDGTLCEGCGVFLNEHAPGYPCYCADCRKERKAKPTHKPAKAMAVCTICGRKVKAIGLADHTRDSH